MTLAVHVEGRVLRLRYDGPLTADDVATYQGLLQEQIDRQQRFALLIEQQPSGPPADRGLAKSQMQWMQDHADDLGRWHTGMAYVRSGDEPPGRARVAEMTPYPVQGFDTLEEAEAWAREQVAEDHE